MKLSDKLTAAADLAERHAANDIRAGRPEAAETTRRIAGHLRRIAFNHRAAAAYQHRPALDPEQQVEEARP